MKALFIPSEGTEHQEHFPEMAYLIEYLHEICSFYFKFPVAYKRIGILFMEGHTEKIRVERNFEDLLIQLSDFIDVGQPGDITCSGSHLEYIYIFFTGNFQSYVPYV